MTGVFLSQRKSLTKGCDRGTGCCVIENCKVHGVERVAINVTLELDGEPICDIAGIISKNATAPGAKNNLAIGFSTLLRKATPLETQ